MKIVGIIVRGKGQSRGLGYPTANVEHAYCETVVEAGVWTCWLRLYAKPYEGLAVVGMWIQANGQPSMEIYVLNFNQECYGQPVEVEMGERIRELQKFVSNEMLIEQIEKDVIQAREWFAASK